MFTHTANIEIYIINRPVKDPHSSQLVKENMAKFGPLKNLCHSQKRSSKVDFLNARSLDVQYTSMLPSGPP